jgi:uncharacterized surface protein with fasciclin (FAS1) repeats
MDLRTLMLGIALPVLLSAFLVGCEHGETQMDAREARMDTGGAAPCSTKDIVDTAVAAGDFNTLAAALEAADLVDALKGDGPFTVFAPTDEAFAHLPPGTLDDLLKPENKAKLQSILKFHVVPGKVMAAQVVNLDSAHTLLGQDLSIRTHGHTVMVENATVTKTDIECSNGVIHVIDVVMLP